MILVAIPVALTSVGWQMRFLAGRLKRAAREPHVQAAWVRGQGGATLFYRHVFHHSIDPVIRSLDRSLPAMLGAQLLVEWTYRYPGLGKLAIDCAKALEFAGLLATGIMVGSFLVVARWTGETVAALLSPDS